jgi:hypothetical protein
VFDERNHKNCDGVVRYRLELNRSATHLKQILHLARFAIGGRFRRPSGLDISGGHYWRVALDTSHAGNIIPCLAG